MRFLEKIKNEKRKSGQPELIIPLEVKIEYEFDPSEITPYIATLSIFIPSEYKRLVYGDYEFLGYKMGKWLEDYPNKDNKYKMYAQFGDVQDWKHLELQVNKKLEEEIDKLKKATLKNLYKFLKMPDNREFTREIKINITKEA